MQELTSRTLEEASIPQASFCFSGFLIMMGSVVAELEGTLLRDPSVFSYFMLVAFEASGLLRFVLLLLLWPLIRLLEACGRGDDGIRLTIFVATAGVPFTEVERVSNAVLTKFLYDDIEMEAWRFFSSYKRRVVVTKMPRVMVERFVKEHLSADYVVGSELGVNRFGFLTGFVEKEFSSISGKVSDLFKDEEPSLGMGRSGYGGSLFLNLCKEKVNPPFAVQNSVADDQIVKPLPVIFHDGRLVKRPTPAMALLILLWLPIGVVVAAGRIILGLLLPMNALPVLVPLMGGKLVVKGTPLPPCAPGNPGFLFVCTHRTLLDPVVLSYVLRRRIPAVTYSLSRFSEILAPIPTIRLTRVKEIDAETIRKELERGDLVVCPEGTTCREPFLLRFSALFAELTDRIVPVAINNRASFFHGTTARGWKALDAIFFFMNPNPAYEVTFLNQLPVEATCASGKSPHEVANAVQKILAGTLGFQCTNLTRKDKYRILAGNDGTVGRKSITCKDVATAMKKTIGCFRQ